jgi:hypothetical protein
MNARQVDLRGIVQRKNFKTGLDFFAHVAGLALTRVSPTEHGSVSYKRRTLVELMENDGSRARPRGACNQGGNLSIAQRW